MDLPKTTAFVSGANRGLGEHLADQLTSRGAGERGLYGDARAYSQPHALPSPRPTAPTTSTGTWYSVPRLRRHHHAAAAELLPLPGQSLTHSHEQPG